MGRILTIITAAILALFLASATLAQIPSADEIYSENGPFMAPMEPDPGIPDTITAESKIVPSGSTSFTLNVYLYNDEELGGFNLPITWDSPDITCDSVSFVGSRISYVNTKLFSIDNANQRLQAGMIIFFEAVLEPGRGVVYTAYFKVAPGAADQVINIDSTFYPPGGNFALTLVSGFNIVPQYVPGTVTIGSPTNPEIAYDPSSFNFTGTEGGANPPTQTLNVSNSGTGTLNWSLAKNHTWLGLNPMSGVDAGAVDVSVNLTGLTAGTYRDTIVITANADNSPQTVPVLLTVEPPPPMIHLDPTSIEVSAIEGSSLPPEQISVTNTGGGVLNWTASKTSGWLSINPTGGTGDGVITVSFNLAGLAAGTYYDTVFVSDPSATNDPQYTAVTLVVEPPPPAIQLDPMIINITAAEGSAVPSEQINVTNTGGGTLNWSASNLSGWMSVNPASGVGDGIITLDFDLIGLAPGVYYDTVTVSDGYASNSPQKTAVTLTVEAELDPELDVSPSSLTFNTGLDGYTPPPQILTIANIGGGEISWTIEESEGWLMVDPLSGSGNGMVTVSVDISGLPEGTYSGMISVIDPGAVNSPVEIPVTLNIRDLVYGDAVITPATQHFIRAYAIPPKNDTIYIGNFGTTYTTSNIDLATVTVNDDIPLISSSLIPSYPGFNGEVLQIVIAARPFILGYDYPAEPTTHWFVVSGQFMSQIAFEAAGEVTLYSYTVGDANGDGVIDVGDPVFLIDYIFRDGAAPNPLNIGDANGDGRVDIGDIRYLIRYIFQDGQAPVSQ